LTGLFTRILHIFRKENIERDITNPFSLLSPEKFRKIEKLIGYKIRNHSYFVRALLHRSYLEQNSDLDTSNERLEFLGDAVLSIIVAEYLFKKFPDEDEGFLTKVRAKFVNKLALADAADSISLSEFLLVGKNLSSIFTQNSKTIQADAFEAVIGAIYLDKGLDAARYFIKKVLIDPFAKAGVHLIDENFKSQLLEYAQSKKMDTPSYSVVKEEGPHHNKIFTIQVLIDGQNYGVGKGKSKKIAEQNAAELAFKKLQDENREPGQ
jgi:ribonuclease-3